MEYGSTHIGQGPQFSVAHIGNGLRVLYDAGIRGVEPRYIGPVFVQVSPDRACSEASGDIGSSALEGVYRPVLISSVKTGDHGMAEGQQGSPHRPAGHQCV